MAKRSGQDNGHREGWQRLQPSYGKGIGYGQSYGFIGLATDRACERDVRAFLPDDDGVEVFGTRVPMATVATNDTLKELANHVAGAAKLLMPWGNLDAIGFGCTSGSVAIGTDVLARTINAVRPGVPVCNPVDGAVAALHALGCRRVALITPYLAGPSGLIEGYFQSKGIEPVVKASFFLDGDPDMNRVSPECLIETGTELAGARDTEALFISCTGLATRRVIEALEARIGKPVVTSNQALAWAMMRAAGDRRTFTGRGRLFSVSAPARQAAE